MSNESKEMTEIRKFRQERDIATKNMSIDEKINYLFIKGENAKAKLNVDSCSEYIIPITKNKTDHDYLCSIPGFVDSVIEASKEDRSKCTRYKKGEKW